MPDNERLFSRLFGRRPSLSDSPRSAVVASQSAVNGPPPMEPLALVIPPDHISLRLLRAHVRRWDWMHRSQDSLRLASGDMSLFDYTLAQRQRNARYRLIARADKGETITEDDLIEVMGADFNLGSTEVAMILDADRDVRRSQERADDRGRWQKAVDDHSNGGTHRPDRGPDGPGGGSSRAGTSGQPVTGGAAFNNDSPKLRDEDMGTLVFAAQSTSSDSAASLTDWLDDDPTSLVRSLRADDMLTHAEARGDVLYEATVCAWARTTIVARTIVEVDLPNAVRRWLADDVALRAAEGDQDTLDAYFSDAARESEALHRAAWIDAVSRTDGRASAAAASPVPGVTTAAQIGAPAMRPGEFKLVDAQDAVSSLHTSIRSLRRKDAQTDLGIQDSDAVHTRRRSDSSPDESESVTESILSFGPGFESPPMGEQDEEWKQYQRNEEYEFLPGDVTNDIAPPTRLDIGGIWDEPAPAAPSQHEAHQKAPSFRSRVRRSNAPSAEPNQDDLACLPRSADEAAGPAVFVRGRRVDAIFRYVKDDLVTLQIGGETRTVQGPLHREGGGAAVIEPDGTKRHYVNGALSREDGPAIEAPDPSQDVYAINGTVKPLDLPPTLLADRVFRRRLFRGWERAGFPINAELQARALLAVMPSEEREPIIANLRASSDQQDIHFAANADALYGRPEVTVSAETDVDPVTEVPPLPPSLAPHTEDDFDDFYESLIPDGPNID